MNIPLVGNFCIATWLDKALWGLVLGFVIDFGRRWLDAVKSALAKFVVCVLTGVVLFMVFLMMLYMLSSIASTFIPSFEALSGNIYILLMPIILIGTFLFNIGTFVYTISQAFGRGGGSEAFKKNMGDIFFAMIGVGIVSFRVLIPVAAMIFRPGAGTIINPW
jgi:hypothetical protein